MMLIENLLAMEREGGLRGAGRDIVHSPASDATQLTICFL